MKKIFICSLLFAAMVFMVGCGGDSNENNDNNGNESGNNDGSCTVGEFKCVGNESHYCNSNGSWVYDARCENGCNSLTGKCNSNSSGDNNDTDSGDHSDSTNDTDSGDSSDTYSDSDTTCTEEGAFRCNGDSKQECSSGYWQTLEECTYGCDPVTKKCLGSTECKTGEYECIAGNLSYCNNNFWEIKEKCEYGCDASMKQCLPEDCYTTRIYLCGDSKEAGFSYASYYCEDGVWHYDKTCKGDCDKSTGKCNCAKIEGKTWSDTAESSMTWQNAMDYCDNLTACGYSDWHLPTISELRTLIQNCPATETGGECGVTDSCLSCNECWNAACNGCDYDSSGKYSKLGDTYYFWSSSVPSDDSVSAWFVGFNDGLVFSNSKSYTYSVRCVRQSK